MNSGPPQLLHLPCCGNGVTSKLSPVYDHSAISSVPAWITRPFSKMFRQSNYVPVKHQIQDSERGLVPSAVLTSLWDNLAKEVRRIPNSGLVG